MEIMHTKIVITLDMFFLEHRFILILPIKQGGGGGRGGLLKDPVNQVLGTFRTF